MNERWERAGGRVPSEAGWAKRGEPGGMSEVAGDPEMGRFLALVRHEMGQPLTVIQGFSELIRDGDLSPEEVKEYATEIFKEAAHLVELVARLRDPGRPEG